MAYVEELAKNRFSHISDVHDIVVFFNHFKEAMKSDEKLREQFYESMKRVFASEHLRKDQLKYLLESNNDFRRYYHEVGADAWAQL